MGIEKLSRPTPTPEDSKKMEEVFREAQNIEEQARIKKMLIEAQKECFGEQDEVCKKHDISEEEKTKESITLLHERVTEIEQRLAGLNPNDIRAQEQFKSQLEYYRQKIQEEKEKLVFSQNTKKGEELLDEAKNAAKMGNIENN